MSDDRYALTVITQPPHEPLSRAEAKRHLNVDDDITRDDTLIDALIVAARNWCEAYTGRALVYQVLESSYDAYPGDTLYLPRAPVISIDSIKYIDGNGTQQTWATANYQTDLVSEPGRITLAYAGLLPSSQRNDLNSWKVRFTAGYPVGSPNDAAGYRDNVPMALKLAMKLHIGAFYKERENPLVPKAAEYIAGPFRVGLL